MTCTHHLNHGSLVCVRTDQHAVGHIYESTSAGDDRHADGGHG